MFLCIIVLSCYGNKHSGYVVTPMAIAVHQLSFPASLPNQSEIMTCLLFQKLTKDRYVPIFATSNIIVIHTNISTFIYCIWFCSHNELVSMATKFFNVDGISERKNIIFKKGGIQNIKLKIT